MDFKARYRRECLQFGTAPLHAVEQSLAEGVLDFKYFRIPKTEWPPLLSAITSDASLRKISVRIEYSDYSVSNPSHVFKLKSVHDLCNALALCLEKTSSLKELSLNGLPLNVDDAKLLAEGILRSSSVTKLSFAQCLLGNGGASVICRAVQTKPKIEWLDLTSCDLTERSAEVLSSMIKHEGDCRKSAAWKATLREQTPDFDLMGGLRRLTLNDNEIGDFGAKTIAEALQDDMWLKVVDLQQCGISSGGALELLHAMKKNTSVVLMDLRHNPNIKADVAQQLQNICQVKWEPLELHQRAPRATEAPSTKIKFTNKPTVTVSKKAEPRAKSAPLTAKKIPASLAPRPAKPAAQKKEELPQESSKPEISTDQALESLQAELKEERRKRMEAEHQVIQIYEELQKSWESCSRLKNRLRQTKMERKHEDLSQQGIHLDQTTLTSFQHCLLQMQAMLADLRTAATKSQIQQQPVNPGVEALLKSLQTTADELKLRVNDINQSSKGKTGNDALPAALDHRLTHQKSSSRSESSNFLPSSGKENQTSKVTSNEKVYNSKNDAATSGSSPVTELSKSDGKSAPSDKIVSLKNLQGELQSLLHSVAKETSRKVDLEISAKILDDTNDTIKPVPQGQLSRKSKSINDDYSFDFSNTTIASTAASMKSLKTSHSSAVNLQRASQLTPAAATSKTSTPKETSVRTTGQAQGGRAAHTKPSRDSMKSSVSSSSSTLNLSSIADLIGDVNTSQIGSSTLTPP